MHLLLLIGLKALAGGTLVVVFAAMSDTLKPKSFAGLFAAAPSVALVSLAITTAAIGAARSAQAAHSMIAGAIGLVGFCIAAALLEKRVGAITASALAWLVWLVVAGAAAWVLVLR